MATKKKKTKKDTSRDYEFEEEEEEARRLGFTEAEIVEMLAPLVAARAAAEEEEKAKPKPKAKAKPKPKKKEGKAAAAKPAAKPKPKSKTKPKAKPKPKPKPKEEEDDDEEEKETNKKPKPFDMLLPSNVVENKNVVGDKTQWRCFTEVNLKRLLTFLKVQGDDVPRFGNDAVPVLWSTIAQVETSITLNAARYGKNGPWSMNHDDGTIELQDEEKKCYILKPYVYDYTKQKDTKLINLGELPLEWASASGFFKLSETCNQLPPISGLFVIQHSMTHCKIYLGYNNLKWDPHYRPLRDVVLDGSIPKIALLSKLAELKLRWTPKDLFSSLWVDPNWNIVSTDTFQGGFTRLNESIIKPQLDLLCAPMDAKIDHVLKNWKTHRFQRLLGPETLTYHYSSKWDMEVYIGGDVHITDAYGCKYSFPENVTLPLFLELLARAEPERSLDIFLEHSPYSKLENKPLTQVSQIFQHCYEHLIFGVHRECYLPNVRVHWTDVRQRPCLKRLHRAFSGPYHSSWEEEYHSVPFQEEFGAEEETKKNTKLISDERVAMILKSCKIDRQLENIKDESTRNELEKAFKRKMKELNTPKTRKELIQAYKDKAYYRKALLVGSAFMDLYTMARLFRDFQDYRTRRAFIYVGDAHAEQYRLLLGKLGFLRMAGAESDTQLARCVSLESFPQPFFS